MAKHRKYTLEFYTQDKLTIERLREDPDLMKLASRDDDDLINLRMSGLSPIDVIKNLLFLGSAITITCCRMDENGVPDNFKLAKYINEATTSILTDHLNGQYTGKAFENWFKQCIANCKFAAEETARENGTDTSTFDETHIRISLIDFKTKDIAHLMVGYDWED